MQRLMTSMSEQWSRCSATGTSTPSASIRTQLAIGLAPQCFTVFTETWTMIGASSPAAPSTMERAEL
jgi:hypothetical protein